MATRIDNVQVSAFLQDRAGNHSYLANQHRPVLGINVYNPSDQPITITIAPKDRVYLPGLFANEKYANVGMNITKTHVVAKMPIGGNTPVFNSGKTKS